MIRKLVKNLSKKDNDILCIAFSGSRMEAAVFSPADKAVLKFMQKQLPDTAAEYWDATILQQEIELLLVENKLDTVGRLVFVLDTGSIFLQRLLLPKMPEAELREAVRWEAEEYLASADKEGCLDFCTFPASEGMQPVLLAIMPQKLLAMLQQIGRDLKLELLTVTVRPVAQAVFLEQFQSNFLLLQEEAERVSLTAFVDGMPVLWLKTEKTLQGIEKALADITEKTEQNYRIRMRNVFLTGSCAAFTDWTEGVNELGSQQYYLHMIDFSDSTSWQGSFLKADERREYAGRCMAAAGGALLAAERKNGINFLRSRSAANKMALEKIIPYLTAGILLFTVALWGTIFACNEYEESRINALQQQIEAMGSWQQRYAADQLVERRIKERSAQLAALRKEQIHWGDMLETFGRAVPDGCWLSKVQQEDSRVLLYGKTEDLSAAENFISALQASDKFSQVELQETRARGKDGIMDYTINMRTGSAKDE